MGQGETVRSLNHEVQHLRLNSNKVELVKTFSRVGELGCWLGNTLAFLSSFGSLKRVIQAKGAKSVTVGFAAMGGLEGLNGSVQSINDNMF